MKIEVVPTETKTFESMEQGECFGCGIISNAYIKTTNREAVNLDTGKTSAFGDSEEVIPLPNAKVVIKSRWL